MKIWMFVGSVPEDGDYHLVIARNESEAMRAGREAAGYADPEYDDSDFEVREATATEAIEWSTALLNRERPDGRITESAALGTDAVRDVLAARLRARVKYGEVHDDEHGFTELAEAAAFYAAPGGGYAPDWARTCLADHEYTPRERLVHAAALAIAAIEAHDRAAAAGRG